jgi:hypothetical protein
MSYLTEGELNFIGYFEVNLMLNNGKIEGCFMMLNDLKS